MTTSNNQTIQLDNIHDAIDDVRKGKVIIVVDDEDRENEGDFLAAAEKITPEMVNFMATHGRGLICAPLLESRCEELDLDLMIGKNTAVEVDGAAYWMSENGFFYYNGQLKSMVCLVEDFVYDSLNSVPRD